METIVLTVGMGATVTPVIAQGNVPMATLDLVVTKSAPSVWTVIKIAVCVCPVMIAITVTGASSSAMKTVWSDARYPGNIINVTKDSTGKHAT